ncbi:MAG TPA: 3D-(3,5/4)-trihydroxycyclohexane-1,2-dione acylhydrolase (decyclizing) [Desulfomonilia bacterium]
MSSYKMTVAQALVKFLNNQYVSFDGRKEKFVRGIMNIFGHGNVLGLGQALEEDSGDLLIIQGKNEQAMTHAAVAFAKQKMRRQIFACTSSVGPGAANMLTAAATATANRIPVLILPGDTFATRQPDPVLQQVENFMDVSISTNDAFKAVSRYWDRINRPEQLMTAMINAMRVLTDPENTGAVTIALPQDVQAEVYDYPDYFFKKRVHKIERRIPSPDSIKAAAALISNKKKPLLIFGGGAKYSDASVPFLMIAEEFGIPWGETQAGKGMLMSSHPLNLGGIGVTGTLAANRIAKEADLIIGVGTRYTDFTTASKSLFENKEVDFLNINVCGFDAYKLDAVKVQADAKLSLELIYKELKNLKYVSGYKDEITRAKNEWQRELERLRGIRYEKGLKPEVCGQMDEILGEFRESSGSTLTQTRAIGIINEMLGRDDVIIGASGSLPGDLQRMWDVKGENTYHMEYGYSCMGYEINGGLGVKIAEGDEKEVFAFAGDGSYLMLHSELLTSIQEGRKINVLLFDNAGFGCINNLQMGHGMESFYTEFRKRDNKSGKACGELIKVDYAKNAASYGCITFTVRNEEDLVKALRAAKKTKTSTLIDIKVMPKTMTKGYESWWNVGLAQTARKKEIIDKGNDLKETRRRIRKY